MFVSQLTEILRWDGDTMGHSRDDTQHHRVSAQDHGILSVTNYLLNTALSLHLEHCLEFYGQN